MESPFVGQWEYNENGNTYRRIIFSGGTVELWKNGREWMKNETTPWWKGMTWKVAGDKIELFSSGGVKLYQWVLEDKNLIAQKALKTGEIVRIARAKSPWK